MKNTILEPNTPQGDFQRALSILYKKLSHFHCPICHAEKGLSLIDEPYFPMHYDWDTSTTPYSLKSDGGGHGKSSVMAICNNCGYEMLFSVATLVREKHEVEIIEEEEYISKITARISKDEES